MTPNPSLLALLLAPQCASETEQVWNHAHALLNRAAAEGRWERALQLLSAGAPAVRAVSGEDGETVLHHLAKSPHPPAGDLVANLVASEPVKTALVTRDRFGHTPLTRALQHGRDALALMLWNAAPLRDVQTLNESVLGPMERLPHPTFHPEDTPHGGWATAVRHSGRCPQTLNAMVEWMAALPPAGALQRFVEAVEVFEGSFSVCEHASASVCGAAFRRLAAAAQRDPDLPSFSPETLVEKGFAAIHWLAMKPQGVSEGIACIEALVALGVGWPDPENIRGWGDQAAEQLEARRAQTALNAAIEPPVPRARAPRSKSRL